MSVLIDSSVRGHAITHETAWISTGKKMWGPHEIDTGYAARIPVYSPNDQSRVFEDVRFLPAIAALARGDLLRLFISTELAREAFTQPMGRYIGYGYYDLDLFRGLKIQNIGSFPFSYMDGRTRVPARFVGEDDPLYRDLVQLLGVDKTADAQHIWTAERNGMFCFLTMDYKLCNSVVHERRKEPLASLKTRVWRPSELARHLGLMSINSRILSYEGASFPVRPEFSWPNSRRRSPTKRNNTAA